MGLWYTSVMNVTSFEDVNKVVNSLANSLKDILGSNFVGLYLTGSLSYGDFNSESSDIDLLVVSNEFISSEQIKKIEQLHKKIELENKMWTKRIECSYVSKKMLQNILPPKTARPYVGEGRFYDEALYGNEWIINIYWLYNRGINILGPNFKTLIKPVNILDVQEACVRDLFKEWKPKIDDSNYLNNPHYQSYVVLNLCRILYTVIGGKLSTKKVSAFWVKNKYPQWRNLITTAENWKYGKDMKLQDEARNFIRFTIDEVNKKKYNL